MLIIPTTDYKMRLAREARDMRTLSFPIAEEPDDPRPAWMHRPQEAAVISTFPARSMEYLSLMEKNLGDNPGTWCAVALNTPRKLQYERQARIALALWELGKYPAGCRSALVFWLGDDACPKDVLGEVRRIVSKHRVPILLDEAGVFPPAVFGSPLVTDVHFKYYQREPRLVYRGPVDEMVAAAYTASARTSWVEAAKWVLPFSFSHEYGYEYDDCEQLFSMLTCRQMELDEAFPMEPSLLRVPENYGTCPLDFDIDESDVKVVRAASNKKKVAGIIDLWKAHWAASKLSSKSVEFPARYEGELAPIVEELGMDVKVRAFLEHDIPVEDLV